ncbi:universal stress protein [Streptomyces sp. NPDC047315]|uniref:universal stress protein n=1 Tax=Streptomyces sp. NPDC047315 TaxID=3155142 RepID=UPI0033FE8866
MSEESATFPTDPEAPGPTDPHRRVVVGVDGSPSSKEALRWALRQAALINGGVEAVMSWQFPPYYGSLGWTPPAGDYDPAAVAEKVLQDSVAEVAGPSPAVPVRTHVVHGTAADALLATAVDAELLVVGSRGHGGFVGAVLGSVAQHCTQHSPCPVVVVRGPGTS